MNVVGCCTTAKPAPCSRTFHHEIADFALEPLKPQTRNASANSAGSPVPGQCTTPLGPSGMFMIGESTHAGVSAARGFQRPSVSHILCAVPSGGCCQPTRQPE